jgi:hypothetical protein
MEPFTGAFSFRRLQNRANSGNTGHLLRLAPA